jgi:hypothetical protein
MSGVNDFLGELARQVPHVALSLLAANRGGPMAVAAFQGGLLEAQQRREALARQARLDEDQRQSRAAQEAHLQAGDTLAQQQADFHRRQAAVDLLSRAIQHQGDTASDPVAAENALLGQSRGYESYYGVPSGSLSAMIPNMTAPVNRGVRQDARMMWLDAEKELRKQNKDAEVSDETASFQWEGVPVRLQRHLVAQGHPEGQPVKPSQIQAVAGAPTITAPPRADLPNTSEEHFYQAFAREKGYKDFESMPTKIQTEARAQWTTAGRSDQVSLDAAIMAAYHRGDQAELQRLLRLKGQVSEAGRAPEKDHEPSVSATRLEESRLDEKVAYLLRHPQEATSTGWRELSRAYEKLGVDYVSRRDAVARQVARGSAGDPLAPTADDLVAEFEKAVAGQGSAPPPAGPSGGRTQRTATAAEVKRAAAIAGMTEAEYRKQLAARGVLIKD